MQTSLASFIRESPEGDEADRILRACVHCGFCNATCPTYELDGNELDGPRGRIYLIKQLLEGRESSGRTLTHLDRCLTCLACETTCPSGVQYGRLADIGRAVAESRHHRSWLERVHRWLILRSLPHPLRVRALLALARPIRAVLPAPIQELLPARRGGEPRLATGSPEPSRYEPARRAVLLDGCVQAAVAPEINAAAARVLERTGIGLEVAPRARCCGAMSHHLGAREEGLRYMRRNVDAWWPYLEAGAETIVITATGCAAMVKDYGHLLRDEPEYAERAARVSALTRDLSEVLAADALRPHLDHAPEGTGVAYHPPCTLQHGQKLPGVVEGLLQGLGFKLTRFSDPHLCCGSAGTYALLQPERAERLLGRKLAAIEAAGPDLILTGNIGCLMHLRRRAGQPVRHWIEVLDDRLT